MTPCVLLYDSIETGSGIQGVERHDLAVALFFLSRKLLALKAMVNRNGWTAKDKQSKEEPAIQLLNRCVSLIVEISKMPNTFPEITEELLNAFDSLFQDKPNHTNHHSFGLSKREGEVVRLLAEGKCNKEIAAALGLSVNTVGTYRERIMLKLDVHSLANLVRLAIRNNLADL